MRGILLPLMRRGTERRGGRKKREMKSSQKQSERWGESDRARSVFKASGDIEVPSTGRLLLFTPVWSFSLVLHLFFTKQAMILPKDRCFFWHVSDGVDHPKAFHLTGIKWKCIYNSTHFCHPLLALGLYTQKMSWNSVI